MVKRFFGHICLILATVLILCSFGVYAADTPDNKVGLEITFDHNEYVKGETATATIKLTGLTDEKAAGAFLGAFETHIKFDDENLQVENNGCSFDTKLNIGSNDVQGFQVTDNYKNIIVAYFEKKVSLESVTDDGKLTIGTIRFTVLNGGEGNKLELNFEEDGYKTVVTKSFININKKAVEEYNYSGFKGATASVVGAVLEPGTANREGNKVTINGLRAAASDNKGVLIAQLYDEDTGLTKATQVVPDLSKTTVSFDVSKTDKANLKVRYYLWDSLSNMEALTGSKAVTVTNN